MLSVLRRFTCGLANCDGHAQVSLLYSLLTLGHTLLINYPVYCNPYDEKLAKDFLFDPYTYLVKRTLELSLTGKSFRICGIFS